MSPELFLGSDQAQVNQVLLERELEFQDLVTECMASDGFDYFPRDDSRQTEVANRAFSELVGDQAEALSFGLPSEEYAESWGFGIARRALTALDYVEFEVPIDRNEDYIDSLTELELAAYATSLGTCENSADEAVFSQIAEYQNIAANVAESVSDRLQAHPDVLALDRTWRQCFMDSPAAGLLDGDVEKPLDVRFLLEDEANASEASFDDTFYWEEFLEREQELASSSVDCALGIDYQRIVPAITREIEDAELARYGYG